MCDKYNGWSNWETWNAALWWGEANWDDHLLEQVRQEAEDREIADEADWNSLVHWTGETLRGMFDEMFVDDIYSRLTSAGPAQDAIGMYMASVNWDEIASHLVEEVKDELTTST